MAGEEQAARNAFGDPFLVQHQAIVVGDAQVEQRRFAGNHQIEAVRPGRGLKPCVGSFSPMRRKRLGVSSRFILSIQAMQAANGSALIQYEPVNESEAAVALSGSRPHTADRL